MVHHGREGPVEGMALGYANERLRSFVRILEDGEGKRNEYWWSSAFFSFSYFYFLWAPLPIHIQDKYSS